MTVNQEYLNKYFNEVWAQNRDPSKQQTKSGLDIISKIKPHETVIDVGCGKNPFKGIITNLIGVDPAFDEADFKCTIDEFITDEKFDVALCLGSINFGDVNDIERQISKVVSLLNDNGRIYWRCNPGQQDHDNEECKLINFYPWSIEEHIRLADKFNFRILEICWEQNNRRIYAEWQKR